MSNNISEGMPITSPRNIQLHDEWADGLSVDLDRRYTFIASPHDWQVTNYSSSLLDVSEESPAQYAIVPGHGHNSIVDAVAQIVAQIIFL